MALHLGILPRDVIDSMLAQLSMRGVSNPSSLRFVRLPHPRTGISSLFLPYKITNSEDERTSVLEVQMIASPERRSWFMPSDDVVEDGKLLLMTPVDSAFLLVPILRVLVPADGGVGNFRPADDLFEEAAVKLNATDSSSQASRDLPYFSSFTCVRKAMSQICEMKEITEDLTVYRYSSSKTLEYLRSKVAHLAKPEIIETSRTLIRNLAKDGLMEDGKEALLDSARTRAACDLVSQYIPRDVYTALLESYDFTALDTYLKALREEAVSLAAADMNKAEMRESQTKGAEATDKKRKGQAKASYGVEKLKKANVKGMSKISSFFQKSTA
ncbi:hypothetical protein OBBRIDRAFT_816783 [Obba rivulosa]|uniref:Ribonuclease H2 subunit B n=1 Tax=Obba rivulosa TaxID=1052685 RepID=A0A8E2DT67_9APHY|nr:hypothetical protein OBBRIDRAFT_816783 [Obba rivulosa]